MSIVPTANPSNTTSSTSSTNQPTTTTTTTPSLSSTNTPTTSSSVNASNKKEENLQTPPQQPQQQLSVSALSSSMLSVNMSNTNKPNVKSSPNISQTPILSLASAVNQPKIDQTTIQSSPIKPAASETNQTQAAPQPAQQSMQASVVYDDINIFVWSVCKICNKSTKKMAMSPDTWSFSLAKFLELTFHANSYYQFNSNQFVCKHSLFQDHYQYFRFKNIVTVFSSSKISIRYLHLPLVSLRSNVNINFFYSLFKTFLRLFVILNLK